jgi:RimJ/RimL family protein N-acetyltransferase
MTSRLDEIDWPVRTDRLTLRPASAADAEPTWRFRRLDDVCEWMTTAAQPFDEYQARFVEPERLAKTLVIERAGQIIGDLMLAIGDPWSQHEVADQAKGTQAELGWCLDPAHVGSGYATEAVEALIRVCLVDLGLRRVTAECFADNGASWRLMERVGMRREIHTLRDSLHRSGEWLDGMGYALLAEEWQARHPSEVSGESGV